ncbi:MAG: isoprenoid biosynthesis glyoxalase ElbB [Bacteroidia bacterium]|nr:isoprenoid biosynthesis glyoxalase ElbB [Bacteroidia bacterium]
MKTKKFAVILAGCGLYDGSEIHEATLALYFISKHGAEYDIFAPDIMQHHVVNHITGEEMNEKRKVLNEAARIARGNIKPLKQFDAAQYDGLVLPGGYGAAKNLCTYAFDGINCNVNEEVADAIRKMKNHNKPIGALCIAPVILAKVLGNIVVTIGNDPATAENIKKFGARHKETGNGEIAVDEKNKIVTTPCYMLDATIAQIGDGIDALIKAMLELM